jgi:hypothetical protein
MRTLLLMAMAGAIALPAFGQTAHPRPSNVMRGVYVHARDLMAAHVWSEWGSSGFEFVDDDPRSGESCIRVTNTAGGQGGGAGQSVEINQQEPAPLKIAGWSRAEGVDEGGPDWQYSIYVDLTYVDGEAWSMRIAPFERGTHDWQYSETIIEPEKPLASARVYAFIRNIGGTAWFDDLFFGPPDGENLLKLPGFESNAASDFSPRQEVLSNLDALHANTIHSYINVPGSEREEQALCETLDALAERGYGVIETPHIAYGTFSNADDPAFPAYACVNGEWGDRWVEACETLAQYPFVGISVVPDEYNWDTGRLKQAYANHGDERVREFYEELPTYCNCEACQERFRVDYGEPLPEMGRWSRLPEQSEAYRNFVDFRYRCTTDLVRRAVDAVHSGPYETAADSLICVSPICSDYRLGTGVAWDMLGYETGIDFPTTDPYILLHNYLGDSTHWYVTETAMHLVGSTPKRQCGVVLEAGHLRAEHRPLLPVEIYGSALSSVARGAREIGFFHYVHLMQQTDAGKTQGQSAFDSVRGCYDLLERIDPWLEGAEPVKRVALLYSRASDEYFSYYLAGEQPNMDVLTHETDDPRYPFLAQKEVLYYLLRAGVPTDVYFLDQVSEEELADYATVIVPFPFAVREEQALMLENLARSGKFLVVISEFGSVDERGVPYERPALLELLGLAEAPGGETLGGPMAMTAGNAEIPGEFSVYESVIPADGAETLATVGGSNAIIAHRIGSGGVIFLAGEFGIRLPASYDNELRDRTVRILPSELSGGYARVLWETISQHALANRPLPADDIELSLMRNAAGDLLLFAINWEERPVAVDVALPVGGAGEGFRLREDGPVIPASLTAGPDAERFVLPLSLGAQEVVVLRFAAQ